MHFHPVRLTAALMTGVACAALATPASAQSEADAVAEIDESEDVIVVTARRREERLIDVPVAVSAFSGEALEERGALDITDIAQAVPNVTLEASRATNSTLSAFIRGIGQ